MRQASAPTVILLLVAGLAGWLWFGSEDTAPIPATESNPLPESTYEGGEPGVERTAVEQLTAKPSAANSPTSTTKEVPPTAETTADTTPNVKLVVRSSRTHEAVEIFRYTFRHPGPIVRGESNQGTAAISLPTSASGELLIEANGHVPFTTALTAPAINAPTRTLDIFLDPAAIATGIEITALDLTNAPIVNVRVDAYRLPERAGIGAWNRGQVLWSRRNSATDGHYVLPDLPVGDYGVRLLATDADGELLPLLPFARTFALTGSNGFVERAVLEPGCVLGVEVVDNLGQPIDPKRASITLDLRLAGGPKQSRRWIQQNDRGRFAADDMPPAIGACWLDEAVTGGLYRLIVSIDGQLRYDQQLALRQGERQQERIVIH